MSTFEEALRVLEEEVRRLREAPDRYAEGYTAGYRDCHQEVQSRIREALNGVITRRLTQEGPTVAAEPHLPAKPQPPRLSAPTKDQLVRDYLAANPGSRYRDISRALTVYTATRVYALEKRGEVRKDAEGRFFLNGEPHAHTH